MTLAVLGVAGLGAAVLVSPPAALFGRVPPPPPVIAADAAQVSVVDGSTLRLRDRVLRLDRMTAPVRGAACPSGTECGAGAAQALAGLVRDRRVECRPDGHDETGRSYAACRAGGTDLSAAMVSGGWAWAMDAELHGAEDAARARQIGMWAAPR